MLLIVAVLLTALGALLVVACLRDDMAISSRLGKATAEVVSVTFNRTVVRFDTPDGAVHSPSQGVLYPDGLAQGELVRIEYDSANPELARVAGRTAALAYLPVGTAVLAVWLVLLPLTWYLRRTARRYR